MQLIRKVQQISAEEVLSKVGEYDIYRIYIGEFKIGGTMCSPFVKQVTGSFGIYMSNGRLYHADFADEVHHGDAMAFVQQMYQLTYPQAIQKVAEDFGLTDRNSQEYKKITGAYSKPVLDQRRHSLIQCTVKRFTKSDLNDYWGRYPVIGQDKLKKHNVWSLKEVFLNRKKIPIGKHEMVFGYWYEEKGWKIMFPERDKTHKWLSSIPLDTPEGLSNLDKDHDTLVIKSKKCLMVMEEVYPWVCSMQNESVGSVSDNTARYIVENSRKVFYGGDSDVAGKKASYKITGKHSWYHINVPDPLLPWKDWSDWHEYTKSLKPIENHLRIKGLL